MSSSADHQPTVQQAEDAESKEQPESGVHKHRWAFRVGAIAFGLTIVVALELGLTLAGIGATDAGADPFVGFESIQPLFVLDEDSNQFRTSESRLDFFRPQQFAAQKAEGTFRVFCLGGSTVQGRPFATETAFSSWLQINLQSIDPDTNWEVVNCGGISYASYRLVPILDECLGYAPDLVILCTGHNEFLEERSYAHVRSRPQSLKMVQRFATHSRIHALISGFFREQRSAEQPAAASIMSEEVDALLDYRGGLEVYERDDAWRQGVIEHYDLNVRRMIAMCRSHGVPVLLIRPPSNLSDCPPFKSVPTEDLSEETRARIIQLTEEARELAGQKPAAAISALKRARELDPLNARLAYDYGIALLASGQNENARKALVSARDLDVCPLRMVSELEERLFAIAADTGVRILDAHELLRRESSDPILGGFLLVDHIHPSVRGHQLIADRLTELIGELDIVSLPSGWTEDASKAKEEHLKGLEKIYFLRGMRTLEALRAWTTGRVEGPAVETRRVAEEP